MKVTLWIGRMSKSLTERRAFTPRACDESRQKCLVSLLLLRHRFWAVYTSGLRFRQREACVGYTSARAFACVPRIATFGRQGKSADANVCSAPSYVSRLSAKIPSIASFLIVCACARETIFPQGCNKAADVKLDTNVHTRSLFAERR